MMAIPSIDMEATGRNITRLRQQAGLTNLVVLAAVLHVSIDEIVIVETRELVLASA